MSASKTPNSWETKPLKDILEHVIGGDWGQDEAPVDAGDFREVLCIRGSDFKNWNTEKGGNAVRRYIKGSSLEKRALIPGDILLEISGGGPDQPVGRVILVDEKALAMNPGTPKIYSNFIRLLRLNDQVNKTYIYYFLQYIYITGEVISYQGGSNNLRNLKYKEYAGIQVPLPSLDEQAAIVSTLDQVFNGIEKIGKSWLKINDLNLRFGQKCLVDPATSDLYSREKLSEYVEESTARIGKLWPGLKKIGVSARKGIIDLETGQKDSFNNYKIVRPGDFVYNTMRVNIGSIAIYQGTEIAITSPDYVVFRTGKQLSANLLLSFLKSPMGLLEISSNTKGSVRSRLYFKSLCNINYPVAPQNIQLQAEQVNAWFSKALYQYGKEFENNFQRVLVQVLEKAFKKEEPE